MSLRIPDEAERMVRCIPSGRLMSRKDYDSIYRAVRAEADARHALAARRSFYSPSGLLRVPVSSEDKL